MPDPATPPPTEPSSPGEGPGRWRTSLLVPAAVISIAVVLIGAIVLVAQQEQDDGRTVLAEASVGADTLPVTVPYRDAAGAIVIDVTFGDGDRAVPMILDTGAPTIITEELAEVFAGDAAGTIAGTSAAGQVLTSEVVRLPQLAVGGAVFTDVGAVVGAIEPGNPFYCLTDGGFVGTNLLATAVWQVDPAAMEVTIAGSIDELDHVDGAIRLDFTRASDVSPSPLVELPVGKGVLTLLVDTGSDGWLAVAPADLEAVDHELPEGAPAVAIFAAGAGDQFLARARWTAVEVTLGDEMVSLPVAGIDVLSRGLGNAGTDFLSRFVVTIDWSEETLYLDPIAELAPSTPSSAFLGWDDGYVVGAYVEGWPGNEDLELGAGVMTIDGRDVSTAPFADFCTRLLDGPEQFEMTVAGELPTTVEVAPAEGFFDPLPTQ